MKTNRCNNVSVILGRLLYIGFSVQIVLGVIWMLTNIGYVQMFGGASVNVSLSGALMGDGDTGILYPAIVLLMRALGEITFVPWYSYLYIFQIVIAIVAGYFLTAEAGVFGKKRWRYLWGSLVLLTFPPIMQIHMAILVNSLILSMLMLQAAFLIKAWKCINSSKASTADYVYSISGVALFWLLMSLIKWVYVYIGAVPVIATFIAIAVTATKNKAYLGRKRKNVSGIYETRRIILSTLVTVMLFGGLILGIDRLTTDENISQRGNISFDRLVFERIVWKPGFSRGYEWLNGFDGVVDKEILYETTLHQENLRLLLEPELEEGLGVAEAGRMYRMTNTIIWRHCRGEVVKDFIVDMTGYIIPQVMIPQFIDKDSYISYTPRNYDSFKRYAPILSKYYMDYSLLWFLISLFVGLAIIIVRALGGLHRADKRIIGAYIVIGVTCIGIALRNVMLGNSMYDYKEAGSAMIAWFMVIFAFCGYSMFDEDVK